MSNQRLQSNHFRIKFNSYESVPIGALFSCPKGGAMEERAKEILLEKLEEMAEVTPDTYDDLQGYAVLCSAMADLYNAICSGSDQEPS